MGNLFGQLGGVTKMTTEIETKIKQTMAKPYARRLVKEVDDTYTASILEMPGCVASGNDPLEALNKLELVSESWVESAINSGYEFREPIDSAQFSGKIALRLPRMLHKQVAEMALLDETSINQFLVMAISSYVSGRYVTDRVKDMLGVVSNIEVSFKQINNNLNLNLTAETLFNHQTHIVPTVSENKFVHILSAV
jgi:predicted RNase H-like HicB family nuclease